MKPGRPTWHSTVLRTMISSLLHLLMRRSVSGVDNIPRQGPCLLVFNQMSLIDTPLLSILVPRRDVTGLVARDYRSNPFYRLLIEWGGGIWIRRSSPDRAALESALLALERGWVVGISPEGRRSRTGGLVRGKPGPAFLARRSGVPIIPVAFANTDTLVAKWRRFTRPTIDIRVGKPFHLPAATAGSRKRRRQEDADRIMCEIAALLPARYRGVYAEHPCLGDELAGEEGPR